MFTICKQESLFTDVNHFKMFYMLVKGCWVILWVFLGSLLISKCLFASHASVLAVSASLHEY